MIGDDGPEGIVLGSEAPAGMAYTEFQSYLKGSPSWAFAERVQQNEEGRCQNRFDRPDSVLTPADFVSFKANWGAKAPEPGRHGRRDQPAARKALCLWTITLPNGRSCGGSCPP